MWIRKYVIDVEFEDEDRGHDCEGHWEEEELDDAQIKKAVMDYLWREHFWGNGKIPYGNVRKIVESLYKDIDDRCYIADVFAEEIAEYYGGKTL